MLKMEPLEIGNDDKKTFPIKTWWSFGDPLQESLNLDLKDFYEPEVDLLALHFWWKSCSCEKYVKELGSSGIWTRDHSHPKRVSYP